jgi:nitrogen fixation protein FixH
MNQPEPLTPEQASAERRAAFKWIGAIVAILGTSFTVAMVMLYVSATDPSFAVEPDYYDQALNWDTHTAQRDANASLDWRIELQDSPGSTLGTRALTVTLTDKQGATIDDATVGVVAFHNARAMDRFAFPMTSTGGGVFTAEQPLKRDSSWEFRFTVVTAESMFTSTKDFNLSPLPTTGATR